MRDVSGIAGGGGGVGAGARIPVLGGLINEYTRRLTTEDLQVTSTILSSSGTGSELPAERP